MQFILVKLRFLSQHVDYDNCNSASDTVFDGILSILYKLYFNCYSEGIHPVKVPELSLKILDQ